jgi:hypothetical protein
MALGIVSKRLGASSATVFPPRHLPDQNRMLSPLPTIWIPQQPCKDPEHLEGFE